MEKLYRSKKTYFLTIIFGAIFVFAVSMIFVSKYLVPRGYTGMTVFPFVFLKDKLLKNNKILLNHENIHLRQQLEMLILPFFIWYFVEFIFRLIQYRNFKRAYVNISFEREAYHNDQNLNYLKSRKFWSFLNYLSLKNVR